MGSSTPESRAAALASALTNLRLSGIELKHDPRIEALKAAYIDGSLTMEEIIQRTGDLYRAPTISGGA